MNVETSYAGGNGVGRTQQFLIEPFHRRTIDAGFGSPVGAIAASLRIPASGGIFISYEAIDHQRGDSVGTGITNVALNVWAFADCFLARDTAGTVGFETLGLYNFAVAHEQLPDDLVYQVVKAVFENHEEMMEGHAAAAATIPKNIDRNSFLPLHPGAIRYYRQIGRAGQSD